MDIELYHEAVMQFKACKKFAYYSSVPRIEKLFELAIVALKKQIPMKVKHPINMEGKYNTLVSYCLSCGTTVRDIKYCYSCGQKLDWQKK